MVQIFEILFAVDIAYKLKYLSGYECLKIPSRGDCSQNRNNSISSQLLSLRWISFPYSISACVLRSQLVCNAFVTRFSMFVLDCLGIGSAVMFVCNSTALCLRLSGFTISVFGWGFCLFIETLPSSPSDLNHLAYVFCCCYWAEVSYSNWKIRLVTFSCFSLRRKLVFIFVVNVTIGSWQS